MCGIVAYSGKKSAQSILVEGLKRLEYRGKFLSAFSLTELLVVMATISMLIAILMPSLGKARSAAMRIRCAYNLKQINLAVNLYLNSNEDTYPCAEDPVSTSPYYCWLWMGRGWRSFVESYLGTTIDEDNPSVLFCPQDKTAKDKFESTSYAYSMAFYHSPEQIDAMNTTAETYSNPQQSVPQQSLDVKFPAKKILIGEWLSNHLRTKDDQGWWCWKGSRNYLFADGHIDFVSAEHINPANDGLPNANLTSGGIKGTDLKQ
ncbi:MAG: hypothetical protein JXB29_06975 [Sedimentisphaerales bacterium]|nr:hypothetical protein [Sedimentisphaerales bacterium]